LCAIGQNVPSACEPPTKRGKRGGYTKSFQETLSEKTEKKITQPSKEGELGRGKQFGVEGSQTDHKKNLWVEDRGLKNTIGKKMI